jgi:hypothetical protein
VRTYGELGAAKRFDRRGRAGTGTAAAAAYGAGLSGVRAAYMPPAALRGSVQARQVRAPRQEITYCRRTYVYVVEACIQPYATATADVSCLPACFLRESAPMLNAPC